MLYKVTPKNAGNGVNVRKAMAGKGLDVIVAVMPAGSILEGKLSKNGEWVKVDGGYIRAELMREVADEQ